MSSRIVLCVAVLLLFANCHINRHLVVSRPVSTRIQALVGEAQENLYGFGDVVRAQKLAKEALKHDPNVAGAHEVLAHLALLADDVDSAANHWFAALADGRSDMTGSYLPQVPFSLLGEDRLSTFVTLLEEISHKHISLRSRSYARVFLVRLLLDQGKDKEARQVLMEQARLVNWKGIAGFDNAQGRGYETPYEPETEIDFDRSYLGQRGKVRWKRVDHLGLLPYLDLKSSFFPFSWNVAYLVTYLQSPKDQELVLEITSSDPIKVWLNDRTILATRDIRNSSNWQFAVPIGLKKGGNKLLIKTSQQTDEWLFSAGVVSADGKPVGLTSSIDAMPYERDNRPPGRWDPLQMAVPKAALHLKEGSRRSFWTAVALGNAGMRRLAIVFLEQHLLKWPHDPMALLLAAIFNRQEQHLQRATVMLDVGLRLPKRYQAFSWIEKARIYQTRGQYDKAFEVLKKAGDGLRSARLLDLLFTAKGWPLARCEHAEKVKKRYPDWHWSLGVLASCNSDLGRPKQANSWLKAAVRLVPTNLGYRERLAQSYLDLGQCAAAIRIQHETVDYWPSKMMSRLSLGDFYQRCMQPRAASLVYEDCIQMIPEWDLPYRYQGLLNFEAGKRKEALKMWKLALERNPDDLHLWDRVTHLEPDKDPILDQLRPTRTEIRKAIAAAGHVELKEGASIVWLLDHEASHFFNDGTMKRVVTLVRMPVDRAGRDDLGEADLPRSGLVKVLDAYVVDPQGHRREVTSMRNRKVMYPTLEEGSVVVLQYRHIQHPAGYLRDHLASSWFFQHGLAQVEKAKWVLALPKQLKLNVDVQGQVDHIEKIQGDLIIHTFTSEDVPPLRPEPHSLPATDLLRSVTVSTVPSWGYFSSWSRSLTSEVFETDPILNRLIEDTTGQSKTIEEKIREIYHFVLTNIRYQQDYETFIAGVKPHPAVIVLSRGYGDCKDKSVLVIAMLRKLGIKSYLALVRTRRDGRVRPNVPSQQFNHVVVYLPKQPGVAEEKFLDATAESLDIDSLRGDVQGTIALVLFPEEHRMVSVPYQKPELNSVHLQMSMELQEDGSSKTKLWARMEGQRAGLLRKPLQNRQLLQEYAQSVAHQLYSDTGLEQANVSGERSITEPLMIEILSNSTGAARREKDTLRWRLPKLLGQSSVARWTERRHPLFFGPPELAEAELELKLPVGYDLQSRPSDIVLKAPCFEVSGTWNWDKKAQVLKYSQKAVRTCGIVTVVDYPEFRAAVNKLERKLEEEIVLIPDNKKAKKVTK
ncbi:MAG: transglutaminase domain-containing protein [Pseudomonadota bacterium]